MNEIKIYEARIKSFEGFGEKGDISQKLIIDENSIFSINCVIDFENSKAIDIENNNIYDILPRDERGLIINIEENPIKFNHPYVSDYKVKEMNNVSMLYGLHMNNRAQRTYDKYKSEQVSTNKAKVKTKKNR